MANEQHTQDQQQQEQERPAAPQNRQGAAPAAQGQDTQSAQHGTPTDFDGLKDKKPEELTPEDLRWMADTMPGEGPGD